MEGGFSGTGISRRSWPWYPVPRGFALLVEGTDEELTQWTTALAARLTESGAAVIMVWAERLPAGAGYHFHLQAPTQPIVGTTEARAQQISREIEILIRQCPQQYLWGYNRYKQRRGVEPPPEPL